MKLFYLTLVVIKKVNLYGNSILRTQIMKFTKVT